MTQTISGLGGVGKTQTALEYAYRYAHFYDAIWWIDAEQPQTAINAYKDFAVKKRIINDDIIDESLIIEAVRNWLNSNKSWLFIYDNADSFKELVRYLPQNNQGNVLITSRATKNFQGITVPLDVFKEEEAVKFLQLRTTNNEYEGAGELASRLGFLPLALEQAAAYIINNNSSYEKYLHLLDNHGLRVLENEDGIIDYSKPVTVTWDISIKKINSESARQMLNICAYFAPDEIDSGIFVRNYELLPKPLNRDAVDEINFDAVISELTSYSLLSKKDDKLYMHRLLQEVIRRSLIENQEFIECAFEIILNEFSFEYGNIESHNAFLHIAPHVISITEQALECLKDEDKQLSIAKLYNDMGNGFFYIGSFQQSLIWHQKALKIREKALGMEHPDTATNYSNMAVVYKAQGDYGKALALYEKALLIREKALGMEHPDTATIYSNMAGVYHDQGDYGKALALYEKALLIREKVLGMEHPDTAMTYGNMAVVYNDQGDYGNALELYEKALLIREKVLGMEHPDTAMTYGNIATLYNDQGDYGKALALHEKALLVFEKALGMEHPDTAMTYSNMAVVYNDQGDYGKALALHERALLIREKVLGMKHPDTAMTYSNMAIVYHNQGDYEKALELYEKAISIFKDKLGENHPYTITVHNNLLSLKKNNNYNW